MGSLAVLQLHLPDGVCRCLQRPPQVARHVQVRRLKSGSWQGGATAPGAGGAKRHDLQAARL